ncbi:hypothetical protein [Kribbella yunnanensis]
MTEAPVRALLDGVLPPAEGGYAALVFVVSREEGDGLLHRRHLSEWPSIHDLTGRHIAVITPDPERSVPISRGVAVRGVALFAGDHHTFVEPGERRRYAPGRFASTLPMTVDRHSRAVSSVATELQEYFGIAEDFLPCAVIVCTRERQAVAVRLDRQVTVYGLLKTVKSWLDPELARFAHASAQLEACADELGPAAAELAEANRRARSWFKATREHREWLEQREQVAGELETLATDVTAETAALCRQLAAALRLDQACDDHDIKIAETLFETLHGRTGQLSARNRRSLLRRLRRAVISEAPQVPAQPDDDLSSLTERASRTKSAYDDQLSRWTELRNLDVHDAMRSAVGKLGLEEAPTALLEWRRLRWPITAFAPRPQSGPSIRMGRG